MTLPVATPFALVRPIRSEHPPVLVNAPAAPPGRQISPRLRGSIVLALCSAIIALLWLPTASRTTGSTAASPTWIDLIAPLAPGHPVTRNYVLYSPRRGEEHDVVFIARRDDTGGETPGMVEVHVLDRGRWPGVTETKSYGVGYEAPPHSTAPEDDCEAVTQSIASALARNDRSFGSVDGIALEPGPEVQAAPSWLVKLGGLRGEFAGLLALAVVTLLAGGRRGVSLACGALGLISLAFRLPALGLPFVHDQDVQRVLTAALPLGRMFASIAANERRPPLYFVLLHVTEWFGQAESTVRIPAVLAGALLAPSILWASRWLRGTIDLRASAAAFVVATSPAFIARSREVSELPVYALLSILAVASASRMCAAPTRRAGAVVVASHAGLLWVSYLAPFTIAGEVVALVATKAMTRRAARAVAAGVAAGSPSVIMAAATFFRDRHARQVAHEYPALAWGEWTPGRMLSKMAHLGTEALGALILIGALCAAVHAAARRDAAPAAAGAALLATTAGIAILVPVARMQPYYLFGVLALAPLVIATANPGGMRWLDPLLGSVLVAGLGLSLVPSLGRARSIYVPDAEAFGPRFAERVRQSPETTLVVVAHYDGTMMAYYIARAYGRRVNWVGSSAGLLGGPLDGTPVKIVALARAHDLNEESDARAADLLSSIVREQPALVVQRFDFRLPAVDGILGRCDVLESAPVARLLRCATPR